MGDKVTRPIPVKHSKFLRPKCDLVLVQKSDKKKEAGMRVAACPACTRHEYSGTVPFTSFVIAAPVPGWRAESRCQACKEEVVHASPAALIFFFVASPAVRVGDFRRTAIRCSVRVEETVSVLASFLVGRKRESANVLERVETQRGGGMERVEQLDEYVSV
jgi:hypothetical protein